MNDTIYMTEVLKFRAHKARRVVGYEIPGDVEGGKHLAKVIRSDGGCGPRHRSYFDPLRASVDENGTQPSFERTKVIDMYSIPWTLMPFPW